jgi:DNA polymerase III subunit epsilon
MEPALSNINPGQINLSVTRELIEIAAKAIASSPVYIDTETTGLEKQDEIIEISILDTDGSTLFQTLVKPTGPIPQSATNVHGITNVDVSKAPAWPIIWPKIRSILFGRLIVAYNAPFDLRMMQQTHTRYRLPWRESFEWLDVMALYSRYRAIWDPIRKSMRLFSLDVAGKDFQISLKNSHRATADAELTRAVLHSIAQIPY